MPYFWEAGKYLIALTCLPIYFTKTNSWKITQAGKGLGSKLRHFSQKNLVLSVWVFYYEYIIFYENILCIGINEVGYKTFWAFHLGTA